MTKPGTKNVGASVRQRLLNKARETGRPFSELLQYFAMERFLYRLSKSEYADKFVLKGALMLTAWNAPLLRPTMDIDLLGRIGNDIGAMTAIVREICAGHVEPDDGLVFDAATVQGERIAEAAEYEGVRVRFRATLDAARIQMQLDVGFGDIVVPAAVPTTYPTILDLPAPHLLAYSRETAIAEKFEAMVKLGELNSRMKDFFDIWLLSRSFDFDGPRLCEAIEKTFKRRGTRFARWRTCGVDARIFQQSAETRTVGRVHSENEASRCALAPGNSRWAAGIPDGTNARRIRGRAFRSRVD